ncbi:hypothetical protein [Pseudactinotalea sp.]|uniref:hypothetical protein n=1 Tax=Pseudactinotalea sp. TaxID=1926260 RepID=UPI003B3AF28E
MAMTTWTTPEDLKAHPRVLATTESGVTYLIDAAAMTATRMLPDDREVDVVGVPEGLTESGIEVHAGAFVASRPGLPEHGRLLAGLRGDGTPLALAELPAVRVGSRMTLVILGLVDSEHVTVRPTTAVVSLSVHDDVGPARSPRR